MTKKAIVAFVKYQYVSVVVPDNYPENINDWDYDQIEEIESLAKDGVKGWGWEIDYKSEIELTND
jgi:hypothetical protein